MIARQPERLEARPPAFAIVRRRPPLRLVVNRACVAGAGGYCLACDACPGEPCRNPGVKP